MKKIPFIGDSSIILALSIVSLFSVSYLEANNYEKDPLRLRTLELDVEAASQQARSLKLDQELTEERVKDLEQALSKMRLEINALLNRSPQKEGSIPSDRFKQWQQQTERNISHLQQGLNALVTALGKEEINLSSSIPSITETLNYTIRSGDTLEKIAKRYHVSIESIKKLNQLKTNKIQVGQKIKVPSPSAPN